MPSFRLRNLEFDFERDKLPDLEEPVVFDHARAQLDITVIDDACDRGADDGLLKLDLRRFDLRPKVLS